MCVKRPGAGDKINLDIFWLKDESLEDSANSPAPDLQAALEQFAEIANDLTMTGEEITK
jgi:type I restriction enzyme M protein